MNFKRSLKKIFLTILAVITLACVNQPAKAQFLMEYLRANLYSLSSGTPELIDGNLTHYHAENSNNVDNRDAIKMINPGENFGIVRNGVTLAVEQRKIISFSDTTCFRMLNLRQQSYLLEFLTSGLNHPGITAYLVDNYLGIRTPVNCNGTTRMEASITADPRSSEETRFRIIFRYNGLSNAPVRIKGIRLSAEAGRLARITWDVSGEYFMNRYEIEKSGNGIDFETVGVEAPVNDGTGVSYSFSVSNCMVETYYRVTGIKLDGTAVHSGIIRIDPLIESNEIAVYPNPVVNKEAQLYMRDAFPGSYQVVLFANNGGLRMRSVFQVKEGQNLNKVYLPAGLQPGIYMLLIIRPDNSRVTKTISVL